MNVAVTLDKDQPAVRARPVVGINTRELSSPPAGLGFCKDCACYLTAQQQPHRLTPQGLIPAAALPANDTRVAATPGIDAAPCTLSQKWIPTPARHWCFQFHSRDEWSRLQAAGFQR